MHSVYLSYKNYNPKIDDDLKNIAKSRYNGKLVGSGYSIDKEIRDLHFEFYIKRNADNFRKTARRYLKKITG